MISLYGYSSAVDIISDISWGLAIVLYPVFQSPSCIAGDGSYTTYSTRGITVELFKVNMTLWILHSKRLPIHPSMESAFLRRSRFLYIVSYVSFHW